MLILRQIFPLILFFLLMNCGKEENNPNSFHKQTKITLNKENNSSLIFTGVDLEYKSSSVFALDLKSGRLSEELSGQSGDPLITTLDKKILLFNRSSYLHYLLTWDDLAFNLTRAQNFSLNFEEGDPSKAISINKDFWLFAYFNKQMLRLIDVKKMQVVQEISAKNLKLKVFRPYDLYLNEQDNSKVVHVIHHGYGKYYKVDESQALLRLEFKKNKLELTPRYPTLKLPATAMKIISADDDQLMLLGLCSELSKNCSAAACNYSLKEHSLSQVIKLEQKLFSLNGEFCQGYKKNTLLASIYDKQEKIPENERKKIVELSIKEKKITVRKNIHTLNPNGSGSYMLVADRDLKGVFLGDMSHTGKGILVFKGEKNSLQEHLEKIPYNGIIYYSH